MKNTRKQAKSTHKKISISGKIIEGCNKENKSKTIQWKKLRNCDVLEDN